MPACSDQKIEAHVLGAFITPENTAAGLRPLVAAALEEHGLRIEDAWICTDAGEPMPAIFRNWPDKPHVKEQWCRCVSHMLQCAVQEAYDKGGLFKDIMDMATLIVGQIRASSHRRAYVDGKRAIINASRKANPGTGKQINQFVGHTIVRWSSRKDLLVSVWCNLDVLLSCDLKEMEHLFRDGGKYGAFCHAVEQVQLLRLQLQEVKELLEAVFAASLQTQVGGLTVHVLRNAVDDLLDRLQFWPATDTDVNFLALDILENAQKRYNGEFHEGVNTATWFFPEFVVDMKDKMSAEDYIAARTLFETTLVADVKRSWDKDYKCKDTSDPDECAGLEEGTDEWRRARDEGMVIRKDEDWGAFEPALRV